MRASLFTAVALLLAVSCGGCILPVPHQRVHAYGVTGQVVDAIDCSPVPGALVTGLDYANGLAHADSRGEFRLRATRGWHGAYFVGPICLSLLPDWDTTAPDREIQVSAPGYVTSLFAVRSYAAAGSNVVAGEIVGAYLEVGQLELTPEMGQANRTAD